MTRQQIMEKIVELQKEIEKLESIKASGYKSSDTTYQADVEMRKRSKQKDLNDFEEKLKELEVAESNISLDADLIRGIVEAMEQSKDAWVKENIVKDYNKIVKDHPDLQIPLDWIKDDRGVGPCVDKPDFLSKARGALHRAEGSRKKGSSLQGPDIEIY